MTLSWSRRQARVRHWLARQPPAEEMLLFYLELLDLQEPVYRRTLESKWKDPVGETDPPLLHLDRLPVSPLLSAFRDFLRDLAPTATDVLAEDAGSLEASSDDAVKDLLESFLRRELTDESDAGRGREAIRKEFFPRAFFEPVARALRERVMRERSAAGVDSEAGVQAAGSCPCCGWPPQVGVLRDEPDVKGRRLLVCSLCSAWWPFPRPRCPRCGETDPAKLGHHVSESIPHVRVDECQSCRAYLKTVDLRKDGKAVPVVEELASVELDLWSGEQGLRKIRRNLLGL